jgi:hypothetical protein
MKGLSDNRMDGNPFSPSNLYGLCWIELTGNHLRNKDTYTQPNPFLQRITDSQDAVRASFSVQ